MTITQTINALIAALNAAFSAINSSIASILARLTTAEATLTNTVTDVAALQVSVPLLETAVTTLQADVSTSTVNVSVDLVALGLTGTTVTLQDFALAVFGDIPALGNYAVACLAGICMVTFEESGLTTTHNFGILDILDFQSDGTGGYSNVTLRDVDSSTLENETLPTGTIDFLPLLDGI
jgi:hypothetical protein